MTVKELNIVEALRDVAQKILVPQLEKIQDELREHKEILKQHSEEIKEIRLVQERILTKLDLDHRITRIEAVLEARGDLPPSGGVREKKARYRP